MGTDVTRAVREAANIDGTVPQTRYTAQEVFGMEGLTLLHVEGETITVGYLTLDTDRSDFWENDEGAGTYLAFKRGDDPNAMREAILAEGKIALFVERYSHGLDHYSVAGTKGYPDQNWDVGCVGMITPCEDVQNRYRTLLAERGREAAMAEVVRDTNTVLDTYSAWCNGEVFGVVVETWTVEGQHVRALDSDECWGFIGSDHALEELRSLMPVVEPAPEMEPC